MSSRPTIYSLVRCFESLEGSQLVNRSSSWCNIFHTATIARVCKALPNDSISQAGQFTDNTHKSNCTVCGARISALREYRWPCSCNPGQNLAFRRCNGVADRVPLMHLEDKAAVADRSGWFALSDNAMKNVLAWKTQP